MKPSGDLLCRADGFKWTDDWPQGAGVYADSAIVMDMNSGAILYGKQIDKQHYPASITKLLTTLVALDHAKLTDKVEFSQDSISFLQYGDAHIGMRAGEELTHGRFFICRVAWHLPMKCRMQLQRALESRWAETTIPL